jgi:hypothetical protein
MGLSKCLVEFAEDGFAFIASWGALLTMTV